MTTLEDRRRAHLLREFKFLRRAIALIEEAAVQITDLMAPRESAQARTLSWIAHEAGALADEAGALSLPDGVACTVGSATVTTVMRGPVEIVLPPSTPPEVVGALFSIASSLDQSGLPRTWTLEAIELSAKRQLGPGVGGSVDLGSRALEVVRKVVNGVQPSATDVQCLRPDDLDLVVELWARGKA